MKKESNHGNLPPNTMLDLATLEKYFYWRTLSAELDKLFIERVHILLQLSFLLLHILQVLCQGLDFSFMLQTEKGTSHQRVLKIDSLSTLHTTHRDLLHERWGSCPAHLRDAKLAGCQLLLVLIHLLVALGLRALQLLAALGHGLHF